MLNNAVEASSAGTGKQDFLILNEILKKYEEHSYSEAMTLVVDAHKYFLSQNSLQNVSICLSLLGLLRYLIDPNTYYKNLLILEDAKILASDSGSNSANGVNRYAFSQIAEKEGNYTEALLFLTRAIEMMNKFPYLQVRAYESQAFMNTELNNFEKAYKSLSKGINLAQKNNLENCLNRLLSINSNLQAKNEAAFEKPFTNETVSKEPEIYDPMIALLKIARTINAEIDLDTLLMTIAEQTRLALNADRCTVFLIDKEKEELWSKVALGIGSEKIRFPINKGLAGHVAITGETIHIKNPYKDSRFNKEIDIQTGYKTKNILCMPIRNIKYEIIGVFQVLNKQNGEFSDSDEDLLVTIGSSAGVALENNILFNHQQKMLEEQKALFESFIDTLAASIDARDKITSGHSRRVKMYAETIAKTFNLDPELIQAISKAAMLHDIGKIGIRDSVLQKEGKLTAEEYDHIKTHVSITHDILSNISTSESFNQVVEIASSHHEKYDGTGYFRNLSGENIPLGGRILAVADVFDAITSVRHYRDKMPINNALNILISGKNQHFDADIVETFLNISCDKIVEIILSETSEILKIEDSEILKNYLMIDLYNEISIGNKEKFIEIFESYYLNKSIVKN